MTVKQAFDEYMKNVVNLDPDVVKAARASRDNLLDNIAEFSGDDFFELYPERNIQFGSFARHTKCRELDDIDLMIGISAEGATYSSNSRWDDVIIYANTDVPIQKECANADGTLNSTKVTNRFKKKLEHVREYLRSDIKRNGEAVVLNLKSKDWSFDIVPCFYTCPEADGRSYWLIPNGAGKWKKTDPAKDRDHVTDTNQNTDGRLLELIRLMKKWNRRKKIPTLQSYLLETIIVEFADRAGDLEPDLRVRFADALSYLSRAIWDQVCDMKEIESDINQTSIYDRYSIQLTAEADCSRIHQALDLERNGKPKKAIAKWKAVLGDGFSDVED